MSTTIDSKVVEMRFDNKQFEQGISQSMASLEKLKSTLKFDGVINSNKLDSIAKGVDYLASRFTALGQILMGVKMQAAAMVKSLSIDQIGEGWNKYNQIIASTQTIMSATAKNWTTDKALLKDQSAQMGFVTEQLDKLNRFTDETSAKLTDMTSNIGKFTSAGVKLDTATDAMMGIATWGYKSGASVEQMSRAMYNLSQAMGMGALRVQDWMSIENANMATEEFKDTAIKTALELGKLKKGSNGAIYALDRYGKKVQVTTQNFRSTLAAGWLDSSVITATLKKYGDFASQILQITDDIGAQVTPMMRDIQAVKDGTLDLADTSAVAERAYKAGTKDVQSYTDALKKLSSAQYDLGFTAFRASQEAKTLQEAIDYTKDAVSTGWMNTFKIIVGNYLEAKELWTAVTEEMYDVFIYDLERQNEILKEWGDGGGREALLEGIANAWHNIKTLIETIKESFREIFPPATGDTLLNITDRFKSLTYVLKLTEDQTSRIKELFKTFFSGIRYLSQGVKNFWDVMVESISDNKLMPKDFFSEDGLFSALKELSQEFANFSIIFRLTKENAQKFKPVLDAVFNLISTAGQSVKNILLTISKAFRRVFGNSQLDLLDSIARVLNNISSAFGVTGKRAEQFQKIFEALFSLLDIGKMILEAVLGPIFGLSDGATDLTDIIFALTEALSNFIIGLRNWLKEHDSWKKVIEWIINTVRMIPTMLNQLSLKVFGKDLRGVFEDIKEGAKSLWEYLKGAFATIKDDLGALFKPLTDFFKKTEEGGDSAKKKLNPIKATFEGIKWLLEQISPYLRQFIDMMKENVEFQWPSMEEMGDAVVKGGIAGMLFTLIKGFKDFFGMFKGVKLKEVQDSVTNVFVTLKKSIETLTGALKDRIKASTFKTIAKAVLELAAAIFVLAMLPADKLAFATAAVGLMIMELAVAFKLISEVDRKKLGAVKKVLKTIEEVLIIMITGVFVLATKTDPGQAAIAAGIISAMLFEVAGFLYIMNSMEIDDKKPKKLKKMFDSLALLIAAIGISVAAAASGGDWKSIAAAGTVMAGMLFAMAGALQVMPDESNLKSLAGGLALVSASMVLLGMGIALASSGGDWSAIAAAGAVMAGMVLAIAGALKMLSGENVLKAAGAMAIVSVGITLLAGALAVLAKLKVADLAIAIVGMSAALIVLLGAGAVAEKVSVGLLALGGAIALIGVGVAAAGAGVMAFANGLEKLVGLGSAGTETFINGLTAFFANLPIYAENAGNAIIAFINVIAGAKETLIKGFSAVFGAILQALINILPKILELLTELGKGILNMLIELTPDLFAFLDTLFEELDAFFWKWAPRIVSTLIMFTRELLRSVKELVPDITATLMAILIDTLTQIKNNIGTINALLVEIAGETIVGILDGLGQELPRIADAGIDFVVALINGIADGMVEHAQDIHDAMTNLVNALIESFCTLLGINSPSTVFEGFGDNIVQGLINGINAMIESAKKVIRDLGDKILTAICDFFGINKPKDAQEFSQLGTKIIQQLNGAVLSMASKAVNVIKDLADKMLTGICNFFGINKPQSSQEFYKLGLNLLNALGNSIKNNIKKVTEPIRNLGSKIINNFKDVLKIASPSKVFLELGKFIDMGLANGLDKYSYLASDATDSVGNTVIDKMGSVMSALASMMDEDFEDPTIKPVLDLTDVTDGMTTLDNMLAADKSMTLTSYASREFNDRINSQNTASNAFDELKNLLSGNIQNGVTNNNTFNITGDNPKEIAQEVSRILATEVKKEERAWGM